MKKKIAVFANGWNSENLQNLMLGISTGLEDIDVDIFVFLAHLSYTQSENEKKSEQVIFDLPNLDGFDGAVVYSASLNFQEITDNICEKCHLAGIPTVSIGIEKEDAYYVGIDNRKGMKTLAEHILTEHNAKKVLFIAGNKDNNDSNVRLNILRESMSEHGLSLKDEDIFYSDWEPNRAYMYVKDRLTDKDNLPDAIVCANDLLAIFVSYGIEEAGFNCPDDILVTGFDYLSDGQMFYPSIASVKQDYTKIGIAISDVFKAVLDGKRAEKKKTIQCEFIPGESCGCINHRDDNRLRKEYLRQIPKVKAYEDYKAGRMHFMDRAIMEAEYFEALPQNLQNLFLSSNGREGNTFYILMDPNFKDLSYKKIEDMPAFAMSKNMEVIVAKEDGNPVLDTECVISNLIPRLSDNMKKHMYVFLPMYIEQYVYGYIVMADNIQYFGEMFYYKLAKQFREDLIVYRKNLQLHELNSKLNELMNTDALTGVKNRAAYENELVDIKHKRDAGEFEPFAVAMFDVNNLKEMNDNYGHEAGDDYIRNCCTFICDFFKHSPVYRIGGDEFVVLIRGNDYGTHENKLNEFRRVSLLKASDMSLPFVQRISIASGMSEVSSDNFGDIEDVINQADKLMYANKKEMKTFMNNI